MKLARTNPLLLGTLCLVILSASWASAHAQSAIAQAEKRCTNSSATARARIGTCTAFIKIVQADLKKPACPLTPFGAPRSREDRLGLCTHLWDAKLAKAFALRAGAYGDAEDLTRALEDINEAIRLDAEREPVYFGIRSQLHKRAGNKKGEIEDYAQFIKGSPKDFAVRNALCWELALLNDPTSALKHCNDSLRLMYSPNTLDSRGLVYLKLGEFDKAIADYNAALELKPDLAASLYGRGFAWRAKGNEPRAKTDIEAALAADPQISSRVPLEVSR